MKKTEDEKIENLRDKEAVEKMKEIIKGADVCMFATKLGNAPFNTRPMSPMETDDEGCIWFFSDRNSNKNKEIDEDSRVQLTFSNSGSNEFLNIFGNAEIIIDKIKFAEMWTPIVKIWFKEGKDDPDLSLIRVLPKQSYYWDTKHNKMIALLKMLTSIATGKSMDDSVEGNLKI